MSTPTDSHLAQLDHLPAGLLDVSAADLHHILPTPTLIHLPGAEPRPLLVSILLHGNEDVGLHAIQRVLRGRDLTQLPRALSIFVGNVDAARGGVRRLAHQPDYNRIWSLYQPYTRHEAMAAQVVAAMRQRNIAMVVDLHNNSGKNPLYSCIGATDERHVQLARRFASLAMLTGALPSLGSAFSALCPTVSCECGEIGNQDGIVRAARLIEACLTEDPAIIGAGWPALEVYHTVAALKIADVFSLSTDGGEADIQLARNLEDLNFVTTPAGYPLATLAPHVQGDAIRTVDTATGRTLDSIFQRDGPWLRLAAETTLAMLTRDENAIRQDCLGYVIERIDA